MRKFALKSIALLTALPIIVVCAGLEDDLNPFPMNEAVGIVARNNDTADVHLWVTGETTDENNRVTAGQTDTRSSVSRFNWLTGESFQTITVSAGRPSALLDTEEITMTGADRLAGRTVQITFNANQQLTVTLSN